MKSKNQISYMHKNIAIGVDIGGSHISCAAIDLFSGKILKDTLSERFVDNKGQSKVIFDVWTDALSGVLAKVPLDKVKGIGFGMPGPFDYVRGICFMRGVAKYENLYGLNVSDSISSSLNLPEDFLIRFINDATAFAVGEAWLGMASKVKQSLSIALGTGLGSAFISNRIPIVEGEDVPKLGCIYHLPYKDGIADDYFSTRGLLGRYKNLYGKELKGVKELAALASSDRLVSDLFKDYGDELGLFLAPWLKKFKAEILVIGGNISYASYLFIKSLENKLKEEDCNCELAVSELREDAALIGSAYLLDDEFWKSVQPALPLM